MGNESRTIILPDITGAVAFLHYKGINSIFKTQNNGRVVAEAPATPEVYQLLAEFQANPVVPLMEFLASQRRVRGLMLDLRDGNGRNKNGKRETEMAHGQSK